MTTAETTLYKKYLERLTLVRSIMVDKRSDEQIIAAVNKTYSDVNLKTEDDLRQWITSMNTSNQNYLKKWATELKNAGKTVSEIALEIGHTENYVNLLLNNVQQNAMNAIDQESVLLETKKYRATNLANQNKTLKEIAAALGHTEGYVSDTLLGAAYLKSWAKRLADDEWSVTTIASTIGKTTAWVKGSAGLTLDYMKSWAKRLADQNTASATIASRLNVTSTDILDYLGRDYVNSWIHRLIALTDMSAGEIRVQVGETSQNFQNYISLDDKKSWAKRLANGGKYTVLEIASKVGHSANYIQKTLLGDDYMKSWVQSLNRSGKTKAQIRTTTGLADNVIDSYIAAETEAAKKQSAVSKLISDSTKSVVASYSNTELRDEIKRLAFAGTWMKDIQIASTVLSLNSGKKMTYAQIQTFMGEDFMASWAKLRSNTNILTNIALIIGYNTDVETVRRLLTKGDNDFFKNWAIKLANMEGRDVKNIAYWLNTTEDTVRGYLGDAYLKSMASNLADRGLSVKQITEKLGFDYASTSAIGKVRDTYIGNAKLVEMLKKKINTIPVKTATTQPNATYLNDFLQIPSSKAKTWIHDSLAPKGVVSNEYKKWAGDLKERSYKISEIVAYIGQTSATAAFVRDTLIGNADMKAWAIALIKTKGYTHETIKDRLGLDALSAINLICDNKPQNSESAREIRSWVIRLTSYISDPSRPADDKYLSVDDILKCIGAFYTLDSEKNQVWANIKSVSAKHKKCFHSFIGYEYSVRWVKRLANAKLADGTTKMYPTNKKLAEKTGLPEDTIKKYKPAKL